MRACYHAKCDSVRDGNSASFADFDFYERVIEAVLGATVELSGAKCSADDDKMEDRKEDYADNEIHKRSSGGGKGSSENGSSSVLADPLILMVGAAAAALLCPAANSPLLRA